MQELKKVGYMPISKGEDGALKSIWYCCLKEGKYGAFISVERHWVNEVNNKGIPTKTRFAGTAINFPVDKMKCESMLHSITVLVTKAMAKAEEFTATQAVLEGKEEEGFEL